MLWLTLSAHAVQLAHPSRCCFAPSLTRARCGVITAQNPASFRKLVANLCVPCSLRLPLLHAVPSAHACAPVFQPRSLEANGRGYWDTSEENIERLKELYLQCEDKLEGVE